MTEDWDKRERVKEESNDDWAKRVELFDKYFPLVKEYARLNDIEIAPEDDDEYLNVIYGFVWDEKFVDFAYDKSGILFNEQMYTLSITQEDIELLEKSCIEFVSEEELDKVYDE